MKHLFQAGRLHPGTHQFYAVATVAIVIVYGWALAFTYESSLLEWLGTVFANTGSLVACAMVAHPILKKVVLDLPYSQQAIAHVVGAIIFSFCWFFILMVFLGLVTGEGTLSFSVRPFFGPAALWQLMQGASFYTVIALLAYLEKLRNEQPKASMPDKDEFGAGRLFIREGDEIRPLDAERIVQIAAAKDYAEVITLTGTHMLRSSLADLERTLGSRFLRVHRSHIVNINQVERVEPAGDGRLILHLSNGQSLTSSRSGTKIIRSRTV